MFAANDGKGFQITFANGLTASVQFGRGYSCANYNIGSYNNAPPCPDAEIAAFWKDTGEWHHPEDWDDEVLGEQTPAQVLNFLNWCAEQEPANGPLEED